VGDAVIAIGNPFGLGQSVSAGIVSARARMLEDDPYIDFLQTDAAINRGNSGGPLVSADGSVIGVTSTIFSPSGGSVGIGFAIPAETVAAVVAELESHGFVERGYLGISGQDLTPVLAAALAMKRPSGALITDVDAQGPSAGALQIGDVLFDVANQAVTFKNLAKVAARLKPDSLVAMTVLRDGARQSVAVKVGRMPQPPANPAKTGGRDTWVSALKIGVAATTAPIRKAIKAEDEAHGLIITQLRPAGPGALAGLRVGDLITHIGAKPINEVADIEAVGAPSVIAPLLLRVVREGSPVYVGINGEEPP
jgi:serine protease Do